MSKNKLEISDFTKIPNIISTFRLAISLFIFSSLFYNVELIWIQALYIIGAISDKADGMIARRFNWETKLGEYLEGIADGLLIFVTIIFLTFEMDFPLFYLYIAFAIFLFGFLFMLLIYFMTGKWFSVILPHNRITVFLGHLVIVLYIFSIPYREEIVTVIFYLGIGIFLLYLIRMIGFGYKNWKNTKSLKQNNKKTEELME